MRLNDLILFAVLFGSVAAAVLFPDLGQVFQPCLLYFMMLLLFLSFLRVDFSAFLDVSGAALLRLAAMAGLKLIVLPAALYGAALLVLPDYAIPVLLLSGISTGVVAPFIGTLVSADIAQILRMVIVTSVAAPFSLPCLVKVLAGASITIPLGDMIQLLAVVVFIPMTLVCFLRQYSPILIEKISAKQFPISLLTFCIINLGVFSKYSTFFFQNPVQILVAVGVAYVLSVIYYLAGFIITPGRSREERLAAGVSFAAMNNVLVIVFASRFFGPLSPTLAAMYMFPFFTMIVPVKLLANHAFPLRRS
jgi:bile acid:Na+ symporter, BASS family